MKQPAFKSPCATYSVCDRLCPLELLQQNITEQQKPQQVFVFVLYDKYLTETSVEGGTLQTEMTILSKHTASHTTQYRARLPPHPKALVLEILFDFYNYYLGHLFFLFKFPSYGGILNSPIKNEPEKPLAPTHNTNKSRTLGLCVLSLPVTSLCGPRCAV